MSYNTTDLELRERGIIILSEEITNDSVREPVKTICYLNSLENPKFEFIQLILNSVGGSVWAANLLVDLITHSKRPVHITGLGICASAGMTILSSGDKGHRVVTENTSLLCHQITWSERGKYHELIASRKGQDILHDRLIKHYTKHSSLSRKEVEKILFRESDTWLTPQEALKYGLIDKIVRTF